MSGLHLLLIEDEETRHDRNEFHCKQDPRWFDRPSYILNKILHFWLTTTRTRKNFYLTDVSSDSM